MFIQGRNEVFIQGRNEQCLFGEEMNTAYSGKK